MKHIYLYNKDTGAYIGDDVIFPRQEEIRGMVTKTRIETVVIGTEKVGDYEYPIYGNEEVQYEEEDMIGYKDVYDIPDNATEIPSHNQTGNLFGTVKNGLKPSRKKNWMS
ncbi:hypothetical protein AAHH72_26110 [Bacillus cereus]